MIGSSSTNIIRVLAGAFIKSLNALADVRKGNEPAINRLSHSRLERRLGKRYAVGPECQSILTSQTNQRCAPGQAKDDRAGDFVVPALLVFVPGNPNETQEEYHD
jgi:hypothetical protein